MKVINFKSLPKNNFFAPEWNYFMAEKLIKDINFKKLSIFLLNKEKEILKLPNEDTTAAAYTGLENSTTSRWEKYNVLSWKNVNINKIKNNIVKFHNEFLNFLKVPLPNELYARCWFNVMRKGQQIKPHIHSVHPDTYLGGHLCVQVNNTNTNYINPINQINEPEIHKSKNVVGQLTLFQNNIPHFTDIHNDKKERITLAFDLSLLRHNNYIRLI